MSAPWYVDHNAVWERQTIPCPTHKEAQHGAALIAQNYRDKGYEVLGTNKDGFYIVGVPGATDLITIEIRRADA